MQTELKITLQNLPHSEALDTRIREKSAKLEKVFSQLTGCEVVVSQPHRHHQNPHAFAVRINITFAGGEVVVTREAPKDVYVVLRDAFAAAERELDRKLGRRHGRKVAHRGIVSEQAMTTQQTDRA